MFFDPSVMENEELSPAWRAAHQIGALDEENLLSICASIERWVKSENGNPRRRLSLRSAAALVAGGAKLCLKRCHSLLEETRKLDSELTSRRKRPRPDHENTNNGQTSTDSKKDKSPVKAPEEMMGWPISYEPAHITYRQRYTSFEMSPLIPDSSNDSQFNSRSSPQPLIHQPAEINLDQILPYSDGLSSNDSNEEEPARNSSLILDLATIRQKPSYGRISKKDSLNFSESKSPNESVVSEVQRLSKTFTSHEGSPGGIEHLRSISGDSVLERNGPGSDNAKNLNQSLPTPSPETKNECTSNGQTKPAHITYRQRYRSFEMSPLIPDSTNHSQFNSRSSPQPLIHQPAEINLDQILPYSDGLSSNDTNEEEPARNSSFILDLATIRQKPSYGRISKKDLLNSSESKSSNESVVSEVQRLSKTFTFHEGSPGGIEHLRSIGGNSVLEKNYPGSDNAKNLNQSLPTPSPETKDECTSNGQTKPAHISYRQRYTSFEMSPLIPDSTNDSQFNSRTSPQPLTHQPAEINLDQILPYSDGSNEEENVRNSLLILDLATTKQKPNYRRIFKKDSLNSSKSKSSNESIVSKVQRLSKTFSIHAGSPGGIEHLRLISVLERNGPGSDNAKNLNQSLPTPPETKDECTQTDQVDTEMSQFNEEMPFGLVLMYDNFRSPVPCKILCASLNADVTKL